VLSRAYAELISSVQDSHGGPPNTLPRKAPTRNNNTLSRHSFGRCPIGHLFSLNIIYSEFYYSAIVHFALLTQELRTESNITAP